MSHLIVIFLFIVFAYAAVLVVPLLVRATAALVTGVFRLMAFVVLLPFRIVGAPMGGASLSTSRPPTLGSPCNNRACLCPNIAGAKFCRRCGSALRR